MQLIPTIAYPNIERPQLAALENLFHDWHQHFVKNNQALAKNMVFDGFFPYYFSQQKRILFIGWEAYGLANKNYLDVFFACYRQDKTVNGQPLNQHKFHSRIVRTAYGILNKEPALKNILLASKIGDTFGTAEGLSFSFINISKVSNETGNTAADWKLIDNAFHFSTEGRNFIREEIAILAPHIIITMDLGDRLAELGSLTKLHTSENASSYRLDCNGRSALLIDTWHFSKRDKKFGENYYKPIRDIILRDEMIVV